MRDLRTVVLEADSLAIGDAWVDLYREGRPATGGWPGTLREARARTHAFFTNAAAVERYGSLSSRELEHAAHVVHERARRRWVACAKADRDGEGEA